jgi:hypothetical protein
MASKENPIPGQSGDRGKDLKFTLVASQELARQIETYLREQGLYYGMAPRENGDASWTIALHNHLITPEQERHLSQNLPQLIEAFHYGSSRLMNVAFLQRQSEDNQIEKLRRYLTAGVPEETQELWAQASSQGQRVFSSRPDMIIDSEGQFHIIEYNTDGGADKGNTQGITDYSRAFLGEIPVGTDLSQAFLDGIVENSRNKENIVIATVVATVLPDTYRQEYDAQNRYFANQARRHNYPGIEWITVKVSDISQEGDRLVAVVNGNRYPIDVIDREFKLPGFIEADDLPEEKKIVEAALSGKVNMLGSILPYQDKILLATLFDETYSLAYPPELLEQLRAAHVETAILDGNKTAFQFGDETYSLEDIYQSKTPHEWVLKRGGDSIGSTGSKGLVISGDVDYETWKRELERALTEPLIGGSYWVIQKFYQSAKFPVRHIKNSRSQPKELEVINRFAPYYVRSGNGFQLGNALVTAGTDEETYKRNRNNVHGLRQNTYQAVSVSK